MKLFYIILLVIGLNAQANTPEQIQAFHESMLSQHNMREQAFCKKLKEDIRKNTGWVFYTNGTLEIYWTWMQMYEKVCGKLKGILKEVKEVKEK